MMRNSRGIVLISCYLLLTALLGWTAVSWVRTSTDQRAAQFSSRSAAAFHLSEAGLDAALRWLRAQPSPPAGIASFDPFGGPQALANGTYTVTIDPDDNNPTSYVDLFTITATGQTNAFSQIVRRVLGVLRTESFSRYAYFTNSERLPSGTRVWFTGNDHLQGPVHSNDQFNIAGSPVFDGPVSSAAASINYKNPPPAGGNNPRFNGGLTLGAQAVQLPLSATALRVAAASAGGQWYDGNTTLALQSDVSCGALPPPCLLVTNPVLGWVNSPRPLPATGAIFVNGGNASVSGKLGGQLTIGTSRDLIITNNLRYANNPQTNPQSNDVLGLIAEGNVVIAQTAPYNLQVQASIMALNTSFSVENWWVGPPKGVLNVYGGIIQKNRGAVGTFSSSTGQKLSGYSKDYWFDTRLANLAPPFYPTSGQYQLVSWQEN